MGERGAAVVSARPAVSDARGWFGSVAISDDVAKEGLERGELVLDTRLRDVLRQLRPEAAEGRRRFRLPQDGTRIAVDAGPGSDEASYRAALAGLGDRSLQQLQRRVDDLFERVAQLESPRAREELG